MKNNYTLPGSPCEYTHERTIKKRLAIIENNLKKNNIILDIGVGYGIYACKLRNLTDTYIAADINLNYLMALKKKRFENLEMVRLSAEFLPFKANSIPTIMMIEVIEHINDDEKTV